MKRPVLILGPIPRIVTTVARSLHRHGIPVDVADLSSQPRPRSNAIREFVRLPARPELLDALRQFINLQRHDTLIPADDFALLAIAEHEELSQLLHVACPPPEAVRRVLDKRCTLEAAQQAGVPTPKTFVGHEFGADS